MSPAFSRLVALVTILSGVFATLAAPSIHDAADPCSKIGTKKFVPPQDALACMKSFPFNETLRQNVLTVVSRVFDFYTFEDYYLKSPPPFQDSTVNIRAELARINKTHYETDYDFNKDLYDFTQHLNDGHTRWLPDCYMAFQNILPTPIVALAETPDSAPSVFVTPDSVAQISQLGTEYTSFFDSINFDWKRLAGARVLLIDGLLPFEYAELIARTETGNYLDLGTRVASTFSSYVYQDNTYEQRLGDIAGVQFPTQVALALTLIPAGTTNIETVNVPFFANYLGPPVNSAAEYWANNCAANEDTNGVDLKLESDLLSTKKHTKSMLARNFNKTPIPLPSQFHPKLPLLDGGDDAMQSYILPDNKTGVMFVGSLNALDFFQWQLDLVATVSAMQARGVTQLIVDVTNNDGGFGCHANMLHAYLSGKKNLEPTPDFFGLATTLRVNALALKIVASDIDLGVDVGFFTPTEWQSTNATQLAPNDNYVKTGTTRIINGHIYAESRRIAEDCNEDLVIDIPEEPPFDLTKTLILGNSNCASACSVFITLMRERHNTTIVVFGGNPDMHMEYKGMAGDQVADWFDLDSEVRTANLKDDPLAPPDLLVSANMRHNFRMGYSFLDPTTPIAYKSESPDFRFQYTRETYNNPENVWIFAAKRFFG
ncbi:hypothetical protein C2E23DRAFT_817149 [Lenzites betulinus]|nr:hypothetical protein C2E23DRAFT_817149 [Lenzites betulinus]